MEKPVQIPGIKPLVPPKWAKNGHLQTIVAHFAASPKFTGKLEEVIIDLADGDKLKAYFHQGTTNTVVSVFHGLGGDITSDYMQRTAILCNSVGHSFLLVNLRGSHTGATLAHKSYHSGSGEDVSDVMSYLRNRLPQHQQITIGISMGGTMILNLLTGRRGTNKPDAAITVNSPIELLDTSQRLQVGLVNRLYDHRFVRRLNKDIQLKYKLGLLQKKIDLPFNATIYQLDGMYTAPLHGFGTRENYYRECSPYTHLGEIETPLIMLHASDDPFVSDIHYRKAVQQGLNPNTQVHIESVGGHVGFFSAERNELGSKRWLDYFLQQALQRLTTK